MQNNDNPLDPGDILKNGMYQIQKLITVGGMGAVYKGVRRNAGGIKVNVAVKELLPGLAKKPYLVELFKSEARIYSTLCHSNIVRVIDLFEDRTRYYIILEWVEGFDLRNAIKILIKNYLSFPVEITVFIFFELLQALNYAHNIQIKSRDIDGIVHRDISPSNILLSNAGEIKLTDFGISKAGFRLKKFRKVPGKKGYMPPEQLEGVIGDERTDVYSLMVCFFESLTLINPLIYFKKKGTMLKFDDVRNDVPESLQELIILGLSTNIEKRPTSGEALNFLKQIIVNERIPLSSINFSDFIRSLGKL
ncbi:MAG: serine/threonine-protein kinase [Deltaproteobacteria bacterium]|jgi:serine/threonine protein kinase|nr:serine/threonine-protein kinase [Deltaproteobacteria bacterium]